MESVFTPEVSLAAIEVSVEDMLLPVLSEVPLLELPLHAANAQAMTIIANNFFMIWFFYWLYLTSNKDPAIIFSWRRRADTSQGVAGAIIFS